MINKKFTLSKKHTSNITQIIMDTFCIDEKSAQGYTESFIHALHTQNFDELYHEHRYKLFRYNSKKFSKILLVAIFQIYFYLQKESNIDREALNYMVMQLGLNILTQKLDYLEILEGKSKRVQKSLLLVTNTLNKTLQTQQLMLANISHEMRTALNAIIGYSSYIIEDKVSEQDKQKYQKKIYTSSKSLQSLVSDILDVSKINSDQMEIKNQYFWLDETIMHSIDNISLLAKNKNINLLTYIDCFTYKLYGDAQRIMQILTNLLSNAVKYTPSGGKVNLDAHIIQKNKYVTSIEINIIDTGIGMTDEELHKVLQPYVRYDTKTQGMGLGLHISHNLIKKMGGNLTIHSVKNKGSKFSFSFKLKHKDEDTLLLKDKIIYLFNDTETEERKEIFNHKIDTFKSMHANVFVFTDEEEFIEKLLHLNSDIPDFVSITSYAKNYLKFDSLIGYLKTKKSLENITFIAEQTLNKYNLQFFDHEFERFSTISSFLNQKKCVKEIYNSSKNVLTLLIVDDIETNLEIFKILIQNKYPNFIVDLASGGYEAIGMYKAKSYDIIFLDLKMPGLDGYSVIKKLHYIKTPPPIYALTADVYKDTYKKIQTHGFTGLHEKPLKPDKIFDTIEGVMNAKSIISN